MFRKLESNKGFSLIFAIFMLLVFGIIGSAVITMLTTSTVTSTEDLLSSQALFLAETGEEIRIKEALDGDLTEGVKNYEFKDFENFKITVSMKKIADIPTGKKIYSLYSTGKVFHIRRKIFVKFQN